jgi:ligand-binding sensor domain-containing protein
LRDEEPAGSVFNTTAMWNLLQREVISLVACGFLSLAALGVLKAAPLPAYQHQSWSTSEGLPQSSIHQIFHARDGYLWLATEGGAVRFDGARFQVLEHANDSNFFSDDVRSIAQDEGGHLWFGTADGLIELSGGRTKRYAEVDGLPSAAVLSVSAGSDGAVVVATTAGTVSFAGGQFLPVRAAADAGGASIHIPAHAGASWTWNAHTVVLHTQRGEHTWNVTRDLAGTRIQAVALDALAGAWVGTNEGLSFVEGRGARGTQVPELAGDSVLAIAPDAEGDVWIGTESSGLHVLRPRSVRTQPLLLNKEISCIAQASDGSLWVGTKQDGLHHLLRRAIADDYADTLISTGLTSPVILSAAAGGAGDVWVGTPDGLDHVEASGAIQRYTEFDGLPTTTFALCCGLVIAPC